MLKKMLVFVMLLVIFLYLAGKGIDDGVSGKKLDLLHYHNVGNIWLRVSNYGFFGSGKDITPRYPSLEYPGGSGIDYLFRGSLWFGAKKTRRDAFGRKLYWLENPEDEFDVVTDQDDDWNESLKLVVDTLVTVGYDGDWDIKEMLPAYNPLETSPLGDLYTHNNAYDVTMTTSIRSQRRGEDDDGDGKIDEDPVGYAFPFRAGNELPEVFSDYGSFYLHQLNDADFGKVIDNIEIWFPLGFVDLSDKSNESYNFTQPTDDDGDGLFDEDGYPVSEQDFIGYYYDYSPFGTPTERDWGNHKDQSDHIPLNIRVRQMSYQWSYEHIKNLVYVEFDVTNMNFTSTYSDTLFDCAMGIYMDSDVGPQAWDAIYADDVSSYVPGVGYEFAFTYDLDGDSGLTDGMVGSRVCTPDPDQLEFACWTWDSGDGPDDLHPLDINASTTANEKYWLLTDFKNPNEQDYTSLRRFPEVQINSGGLDTRYLFGFYGAQEHTGDTDEPGDEGYGIADYLETDEFGNYFKRWNLAPGKTMKIVIAVFPGDDLLSLKQTSIHAKDTYGEAQGLTEVTQPDTFIHYIPPEPPEIPMMYAELVDDGRALDVYWDNRSEIDNVDTKTVKPQQIGWQAVDTLLTMDSHMDVWNNDPDFQAACPPEFAPYKWDEDLQAYTSEEANRNSNAYVNPWTGYRLRHDFQGYSLWGRSGSGSQEFWMLKQRWDKVDTDQDYEDYLINYTTDLFIDFGGETGLERGLPDTRPLKVEDLDYYHFDEKYRLVQYTNADIENNVMIAGEPVYNWDIDDAEALEAAVGLSFNEQALLYCHPDLPEKIYLEIYDDKLIPLTNHLGQSNIGIEERMTALRENRLSRRYYKASINNPPKGIEYYVAVSAWDRGMPSLDIPILESARDADANMKVFYPGSQAKDDLDNIYVVPNPYISHSKFDGRINNDTKGDKSRRLWFVNLPEKCTIKIWTLAGDLVDVLEHDGNNNFEDIISVSKAAMEAQAAGGLEPWDILTKYNQIPAPGIYLFSVHDHDSGKSKVGKFVIIK
ncbi:MAG: hypothetical protein K9M99_06980 [Candidatus Cloacimonetes bacterium]|nr:hypothetical protein [Candidatus Cloacimonadota bacterium]